MKFGHFVTSVLAAAGTIMAYGQDTSFTLEDYTQFMDAHRDMNAADLVRMYPAGYFTETVPSYSLESVNGFATLDSFYHFDAQERELLTDHGFMVTERLSGEKSMVSSFVEIYNNDLPLFVSADAILHAFHYSYVDIVKEVELNYLLPLLKELLSGLHAGIPGLEDSYGSDPVMAEALRDLDLYLCVPMDLLNLYYEPFYQENEARIEEYLAYIFAEDPAVVSLFTGSDNCSRSVDFSQFKPRGHYTYPQELSEYFRAMIWLGRTEIYLTEPSSGACPSGTEEEAFETIRRQVLVSSLICRLFSKPSLMDRYAHFEEVISSFVGEQDNVTLTDLMDIFEEAGINSPVQLLENDRLEKFQEVLLTKSFAGQKILSQLLNGGGEGPVEPASAFMLFGQRFVIDSYVTGQVVYDRIQYQGDEPCRLFPKTLDILFALGNDAATHLLLSELEEFHYATNLAGLRYLISRYPEEFWKSSLYNAWLRAIRTLNPPEKREDLPVFMQTGAWGLQKMNTQLSSWTQLRHDNLLYAKQSYGGELQCGFPRAYVEPNPDFFEAMTDLSQLATERFGAMKDLFEDSDVIRRYFAHFGGICDTLRSIAEKEVQQIPTDQGDLDFLNRLCTNFMACGSMGVSIDGWYPDLIYVMFRGHDAYFLHEPNLVVADYHTTPTDCSGLPIGAISHAGTGFTDLMVTVVEMPDGQRQAYAGPVMSYHEYVTHDFERLTDEEWQESYLAQSQRPEWVSVYLSTGGEVMETDLKLFSSREELDSTLQELGIALVETGTGAGGPVDDPEASLAVFPNPAGNSAVISVKVRHRAGTVPVLVELYDMEGRQVETIVSEPLPPGNHLFRWERKAHQAGPYILRSICGDTSEACTLILAD
jgi:hypothetical protein